MASPQLSIRPLREGEAAACEAILRALPDWFGIEESLVQYVRDLAWAETFVAEVPGGSGFDGGGANGGRVVGFLALRRHFPWSAEIHVIAVAPERHRSGIGRALVEHAQRLLRERGVVLFQVKTLGPSRPSAHYDRTRTFYERMGFRALEENALWGPVNPCLILVKALATPRPDASDARE